jgi:hypothetical protein
LVVDLVQIQTKMLVMAVLVAVVLVEQLVLALLDRETLVVLLLLML